MHFLHAFGRGVLIVLVTVLLSLWTFFATAYLTVLQRQEVMGWLANSGAYDNIVNSVVRLLPTEGEDKQFLSEEVIRQAVNNTLTPTFIRQSTEVVINASYDWLHGKTDSITFSIPLAEKRPELQKHLSNAIEPQILKLPECTTQFSGLSSQNMSCVPKGANAKAMADDLARRAVESTDFLQKPLTPADLAFLGLPDLSALRWLVIYATYFVVGLPLFAIICAVLYVLLYNQKLLGLRVVARRIFLATLVTVIVSGSLWALQGNISLSAFGDEAIVADVIDPLFHQIVGSVSMWLFIFSGSVGFVSGALWLVAWLIERQKKQQKPLATSQTTPPLKPLA